MKSDYLVAIERLRSSTARLNSIADSGAKLVKQLEDFLSVECKAGVHASVKFNEWTEDRDGHLVEGCKYLRFTRFAGKFRICIDDYVSDDGPSIPTPWSESSRQLKIDSLPHLPLLIDEISKAVEKQIAEADKSVSLVEMLMKSLPPKGGGAKMNAQHA